jgi:hypothetical protein
VSFLGSEVLTAGSHLSLGVLDEPTAEDLDALVEVFDGENHARAASEGLNFGSSVLELGNKALDL